MPSTPPDGEPAPTDGRLPAEALSEVGSRPFGVYVHVPWCAHRCGYCDFNTYVDTDGAAANTVDATLGELRLARRVLERAPSGVPVATTLFLGGGTPTLLPVEDLATIVDSVRDVIGLTADAEVTSEANPETLDRDYLHRLRAAGVNRLSLGMQSATPHVLATLERRHSPGRVQECVGWARAAGFDSVSLDLIFGTPGESLADWRRTLDAALATEPDHISAYSLIVESGTRLAAQVARGDLTAPDDDVAADCYELADEVLAVAGLEWYEISNWARGAQHRSRHNLLYWTDGHWWGVGPGAHSHVGGVRWWNTRLPRDHAQATAAGRSPAAGRELLDPATRRRERVLLGIRLAGGHPVDDLLPAGRTAAGRLAADGLLDPLPLASGRLVLTLRGRLLADAVLRQLLD